MPELPQVSWPFPQDTFFLLATGHLPSYHQFHRRDFFPHETVLSHSSKGGAQQPLGFLHRWPLGQRLGTKASNCAPVSGSWQDM